MTCACKSVNQVAGGCVGGQYTCKWRCKGIAYVEAGRAEKVSTCWEKSHARIDGIRANHGGKNG